MILLLTGCTGWIGSELLYEVLRQNQFEQIYLPVRAKDQDHAESRLKLLLNEWKASGRETRNNWKDVIKVFPANLSLYVHWKNMPRADIVLHAAALTDLRASRTEARINNLQATQHALKYARKNFVEKFVYFSTAYVSGYSNGVVTENSKSQRFRNFYEKSKFESEICVKESGVPYLILRPSIVIGDSRDGYIRDPRMIYSLLRAWESGYIPRAPMNKNAAVDLIPINKVVESALALTNNKTLVDQVFHLCAGKDALVQNREVLKIAETEFGFKPIPVISLGVVKLFLMKPLFRMLPYPVRAWLEPLAQHLNYYSSGHGVFCTKKLERVLGRRLCSQADVLLALRLSFNYCKRNRWGKSVRGNAISSCL